MSVRYCGNGRMLYPGDRCNCCGMHYNNAFANRSAIPGSVNVEFTPNGPEVEVNLGGGLEYNVATGDLEQRLPGGLEIDLNTGQVEMNIGGVEFDI